MTTKRTTLTTLVPSNTRKSFNLTHFQLFSRKDFAYLNKIKKKTRKDLVEESTVEVVWSPSLRRWYVIQVQKLLRSKKRFFFF
jgi:hypothetical protein